MTIYNSDMVTINGEEIAITQAETADLISYLNSLPDWAEPEVEPVAQELCCRLDVDFDDFDDYDTLYDALVNKNHDTDPV